MGFASADPEVEEFIDFSVDKALGRTHTNTNFLLAPVAGLSARVLRGQRGSCALLWDIIWEEPLRLIIQRHTGIIVILRAG